MNGSDEIHSVQQFLKDNPLLLSDEDDSKSVLAYTPDSNQSISASCSLLDEEVSNEQFITSFSNNLSESFMKPKMTDSELDTLID